MARKHIHSDTVAISASLLCLLHCMVVPVLATTAPMFLAHTLEAPWFHLVLFLLIFPAAVWALGRGYLEHKRKFPIALGMVGLSLVSLGSLWHWIGPHNASTELLIMTAGSLLLIVAHLRNYYLRLDSGHHSH